MTIEKARRICDVLNKYAETIPGERGVACLNAIEAFEDELDVEERLAFEETQLDERVQELTRFVIRKSPKRRVCFQGRGRQRK